MSCCVSLAFGNFVAAGAIFFIIVMNASIGVFQEAKAGKELEALEALSSDKCDVVRDGSRMVWDALCHGFGRALTEPLRPRMSTRNCWSLATLFCCQLGRRSPPMSA